MIFPGLIWLAWLTAAQSAAAPRVFVETEVTERVYLVHESIALRLRIGFENAALQSQLVQPFRRLLDAPLQLVIPWLEELPGADVSLANPPADGGGGERLSLVVNDAVLQALRLPDRRQDDRVYTVLEIPLSVLPEAAGELRLAAPQVRFAYATTFRQDLLQGRVPTDRHDGTVAGTEIVLDVQAPSLPEAPAGYRGAIGQFTTRAEASPQVLRVGDAITVQMHIEGQGNFQHFQPPAADFGAAFHVLGTTLDRTLGQCTVTAEVTLLDPAAAEIPALAFVFLDPGPPAVYRTVKTPPIPLRVQPAASTGPPSPPPPVAEPGPLPVTADQGGDSWSTGQVAAAAALALLALTILALLRRRPATAATPPVQPPAPGDPAPTRRPLPKVPVDSDPAAALAAAVAGFLDCSLAAAVRTDLASALSQRGMPADRAERIADLLQALTAARYGGPAVGRPAERVRALLAELE